MLDRISWEKYAANLAIAASLRSEDPHRKVGACALGYDNRVLGVAYNGLQSGFNVSDFFWVDRDSRRPYMIHAETNLLSLFNRGECRLIAVTLLPCEACARQIVAWNIPEVVYISDYDNECASKTKIIFEFYKTKLSKITV
jgi:dCMP deaminase